ncbi:MAG: hypothetical protein JWO30_1887 [Fibrobacteres bacterium]|nr:hypothetical protein [Fibrobacterota bacterium]
MERNFEEKGQATILEEGEIFFFYRPRADSGISGAEAEEGQIFMVLHPLRKSRYRLIHLGKQYPPALKKSGPRIQASIDKVMASLDELRAELVEQESWSGNRGKRARPAALQVGEGIYALLKYRDNTHLVYALDDSIRENGLLEEMGIAPEGGYTTSVRNPDTSDASGNAKHPDFPRHLLERFRGRESIPIDPIEFLNEEGAELLLTGISNDPMEDLGIEFNSRNGSRTDHSRGQI